MKVIADTRGPHLTDAELDQCRRDGALLHSLVSEQVMLKRDGRAWKGCCPFHDDATPSFTVYNDGHFRCYGCEAHGTVFDYVMRRDSVGFREAAERVAVERGIPLVKKKSNGAGVNAASWQPMVPLPANAPKPTADQLRCDLLHEYYDADDNLLWYVRRHESRSEKRKQFFPLTYGTLNGKCGWHPRAPNEPRPLYGLNRLSHAGRDATVLLVEGEKSADAAQRLFPYMVAMTWMGGANAVDKADWAPLEGRNVIIWPDADRRDPNRPDQLTSGEMATATLRRRFPTASVVDTTGLADIEDGYDAADLEHHGCDGPEGWLEERLREPPRQEDISPDGESSPGDFAPEPWLWRDPTTLPPRQWLLGTTLLRGYATVLSSTGGSGKTSFGIACGLAVITGRRDVVDQHVFQTGHVWLITLEDDREELDRRIAAAMIAHEIKPEDVAGKLFVNDTSRRGFRLAEVDEKTGAFKVCGDAELIIDFIRKQNIVLTIIDPLVKSHRVVENSNEHMDGLITLANEIAHETRSSILLTCHFRKGGNEDGGRDAIRGGSAFVDGSRVARTLIPMPDRDARAFNISPDAAFQYVRVQDAKGNMAPRQAASWFQLVSIPLCNTEVDPAYPAGDNVQAAKPWHPPTTFAGVDGAVLRRIFDCLRGEPKLGWHYSLSPRAKFWAGAVIMQEAGKSRQQASEVLALWLQNDVLAEADYLNPNRRTATRIVLNETKIAEILAATPAFDE